MKNATEFAKKFKTFRRKLPLVKVAEREHGVIGEVIYSHLISNASSKQASDAFKRLVKAAVDLNELRVNMVDETIELIGINYPEARDRSKRLHTVLNSIYNREHGVHISSLDGAGKREIREYFETLNGITEFVCNRIISVHYGVAAVPVDRNTHFALKLNSIIHEESTMSDTASWLSRQVKADDLVNFHYSLQAWVETQPNYVEDEDTSSKQEPATKKKTKKKTTKKKVAKKPVKKAAAKKQSKKKTSTMKKVNNKPAKKKTTKKKVSKKTKK